MVKASYLCVHRQPARHAAPTWSLQALALPARFFSPTFILFRTLSVKRDNRESIQSDPLRKIPEKIRASNREVALVANTANFASANALPVQCGENSTERYVCEKKNPQQTERAASTQAAFLVEMHCEQQLD